MAKGEKEKKNKKENIIDPEVYEVSEDTPIKDYSAVMENNLIEARYSLTVEEQRLVLSTIALLDSMETAPSGFPMLKIPKKLIIEATGLHEKNYHVIKTALKRLMQKIIEIETVEKDGKKRFRLYQWFAKGEYHEGGKFIEVQFHPDLKPYLLALKEKFTDIPLKIVLRLRSKYAIRLYELLRRYKDTGFRIDTIEELREKLGVEKGEYPRFFDFEKRVLIPAVKEINKETDLLVSYKKIKKGRKIVQIEFTINHNPDFNPEELEELEKKLKEYKQYLPLQSEKTSLQSLDTQGLVKGASKESKQEEKTEENQSKKFDLDEFWNEVKEYRKKYWEILEKYNEWKEETKRTHKDKKFIKERLLPENSVLFLLINAEENGYPPEMALKAIQKAILNKQVKNPMGFLIDFFDIDMLTAKFDELTSIEDTPDKEAITAEQEQKEAKSKLEEMLKNKEIFEKFKTKINKSVIKAYISSIPEFETLQGLGDHLIRMLVNAVIDKENKVIYMPTKDQKVLDWFEVNFKEHFENFVREKAKRDYTVKPVLFDVKLLEN